MNAEPVRYGLRPNAPYVRPCPTDGRARRRVLLARSA